MKSLLKFWFVIIFWSIPVPCPAAGPSLSEQEAAGVIRAHFGYPIAVIAQINFRDKSPEMLAYLKNAGYIADSPTRTCCGDFYTTTEKGKPHFGDFVKYLTGRNLSVDCVYAKKEIKSIETVSVDVKRGATVTYTEALEPNEPVYSEVFRQSQEGAPKIDFNKTEKMTVRLRFDGKGWRVEEKQVSK